MSLKKAKSRLVGDPELATLDNPSVRRQLANKTSADTASLSQQPDFQEYLNTEVEIGLDNGLSKLDEHNIDNDHYDIKSTKSLQSVMESDSYVSYKANLTPKSFNDLSNIPSESVTDMVNETSNKSNRRKSNAENIY